MLLFDTSGIMNIMMINPLCTMVDPVHFMIDLGMCYEILKQQQFYLTGLSLFNF